MNCPECGAPDGACEIRYNECLVKEFTDAHYGQVHHLTVATYMLQHSGRLTKEGWLYERALLREFLIDKKPPALIRKQNRDLVDSGRRKFKITSQDGLSKTGKARWNTTILSVRMDDPAIYCDDVKAWAQSALAEAEQLEMG